MLGISAGDPAAPWSRRLDSFSPELVGLGFQGFGVGFLATKKPTQNPSLGRGGW